MRNGLILFVFLVACLTACEDEKKTGEKPDARAPSARMEDDDKRKDSGTSSTSSTDNDPDDMPDAAPPTDNSISTDNDPDDMPDAAPPTDNSMTDAGDAGGNPEMSRWICDPAFYYASDGCDCNCGIYDPDCKTSNSFIFGCENVGATCNTAGECEGGFALPHDWTCLHNHFAANDGCDCNCGAYDPDCDDPDQSLFGCSGVDATCNADGECEGGTVPPLEWTCNIGYGDGEICDCECGAYDPDCDDPDSPLAGCNNPGATCNAAGECEGGVVLPPEWTCPPGYYGTSDGCDCECGIYDPDCDDPGQDVLGCDNVGATCDAAGECEGGVIPPPVPPEWTCPPEFYNVTDGCDCECGVYDLDCDDPGQDVFGCDNVGATCNAAGECEGGVMPPPEWMCYVSYYGDGEICDCECGAYDPDCDDPDSPLAGCNNPGATCNAAGECEGGVVLPPEWTCPPGYYGTSDGCDCECGIYDPDCDDPDQDVFGCDNGATCDAVGECVNP